MDARNKDPDNQLLTMKRITSLITIVLLAASHAFAADVVLSGLATETYVSASTNTVYSDGTNAAKAYTDAQVAASTNSASLGLFLQPLDTVLTQLSGLADTNQLAFANQITGLATTQTVTDSTNIATLKLANTNVVGVIPIANLATGTPDGTKFVADDGTLKAAGSASPTTTAGDMIVRGASADDRLAVGDIGSELISTGTSPIWATISKVNRNKWEFFTSDGWTSSTSSGVSAAGASDATEQGVWTISTGATNGNYTRLYLGGNDNITLGDGTHVFRFRVKLSAVPSVENKATINFGIREGSATVTTADMVVFQASDASANWSAKSTQNTDNTTTASGGANVAIDTDWHVFTCIILGSTTATFYVDSTQIGTASSNIPNGIGRESTLGFFATHGDTGSTSITVSIGFVEYIHIPTTSR